MEGLLGPNFDALINRLNTLFNNIDNFFNPVYIYGSLGIITLLYLIFWFWQISEIIKRQRQTNELLWDIRQKLYENKEKNNIKNEKQTESNPAKAIK